MKLIVGLGNPEDKYKNNRHNVGYMFIDNLQNRLKNFSLVKSKVFMNSSGEAVKKLVKSNNTKLDELYIAHDDLDIPLGSFKIQFGIGPKVHNGINDIEKELATNEFWRIRIGVDNRDKDNRTVGEEYVLEDFSDDEMKTIDNVINEICKKLVTS